MARGWLAAVLVVGGALVFAGALAVGGGHRQATRPKSARDQATRDQATQPQAARPKSARDQATRDQATQPQASRDQATRTQTTRHQATRDQATISPPELRAPSYASAVSANYRVLTPRQSRRLLAFAENLRTCLHEHGVALGAPQAARRIRIELALPEGAQRRVILAEGTACAESLGGPPPGASLQLRPSVKALLLYLPKYCLLDPKVTRRE